MIKAIVKRSFQFMVHNGTNGKVLKHVCHPDLKPQELPDWVVKDALYNLAVSDETVIEIKNDVVSSSLEAMKPVTSAVLQQQPGMPPVSKEQKKANPFGAVGLSGNNVNS